MAVATGCGRFGFGQLAFDTRQERPDPATGSDADPDRSPPEASDAGAAAELDGSLPGADEDAGSTVSTPPQNDAGTPVSTGDAGSPSSDGSVPPTTLEPLPQNIDCTTSFTGLIACENFSGSKSGVPVVTHASGVGSRASTDGYLTGTTTQDSSSANVEAGFNALTSGAVYLRFSLFVPGDFGIQGLNVASLGDVTTGTDFGLDLNLMRNGQLEIKTSGDGAVNSAGSYLLPRNRWVCVLLKVETIDSASGSARVLIDGREILAANNIDTEPAAGITGASAGIDWTFNQQAPATVYVDNFVVTRDHPSACP